MFLFLSDNNGKHVTVQPFQGVRSKKLVDLDPHYIYKVWIKARGRRGLSKEEIIKYKQITGPCKINGFTLYDNLFIQQY